MEKKEALMRASNSLIYWVVSGVGYVALLSAIICFAIAAKELNTFMAIASVSAFLSGIVTIGISYCIKAALLYLYLNEE